MTHISKALRKQIQDRANDCCEYCRKPNKISTYSYHIDHIIPLKHQGTSDSDNLAWSCFDCNVSKGRDIASYDDNATDLIPLFNPRKQLWEDHFNIRDTGQIIPLSAIGRVTVRVLDINAIDRVNTRNRLMQLGLW